MPLRDKLSLVRGRLGLDALGKFFRCRRHRRPRSLLFRHFLVQHLYLRIPNEKLTFRDMCSVRMSYFKNECPPKAVHAVA